MRIPSAVSAFQWMLVLMVVVCGVACQPGLPTSPLASQIPELIASTPTLTPVPAASATVQPSPVPSSTPQRQREETATPAAPRDQLRPTQHQDQASTEPPADNPRAALTQPSPLDLYTVVNVAVTDTLNLRESPGLGSVVIATLPPYATGIRVTGPAVVADNERWVPVDYQGTTGWANRLYLALQFGTPDEVLAIRSHTAIQALERRDFATLSTLVHPERGLRFTAYMWITDEDMVFTPADVATLYENPTTFTWGRADGSGYPIERTFAEYYARFVFDYNFAWSQAIGFDRILSPEMGAGNITTYYPDGTFVEYHFLETGVRLGDLGWKSLRLVFVPRNGEWMLVGISHSEWTI